ncbi:alpha/beta hydrolase family protein [Rhodococcus sp. ARC_M6]|uniref:alpha/beta hydrolase family protein n=1 Tax=Rhodococcus sp. ARC_M6 TaxID=2928852 RepID=UPI001FB32E95|nr:alpha/beta hydrolase family protein [Rhodococcus sp. ARC_M6]MCJ0904099.1 alpha/beta hydrolase [Rhodococcus sp. ARC_M6]
MNKNALATHQSRATGLTTATSTASPGSKDPLSSTPTFETWFGPDQSPLFGSVHVAAGARARGGIVICPPLAKEHISTYRGMRQLAEQLADAGFMVLRFEYLGQGDSSGGQNDPNAVQHWIDSVEHAVRYLHDSGVVEVGIVGLRAGSLIAANAASRLGPLRTLVLWDPVPTGRAYVREQTAFYRMSMGEDPSDDGIVSFIGGTYAPEAVEALAKLKIDPTAIGTPHAALIVQRSEQVSSERLRKLTNALGADTQTVAHQEAFVSPSSFVMSVPTKDIQQITNWISEKFPTSSMPVTPRIRAKATVGWSPDGEPVYETLERRGAGNLLTIVTTPATETTSDTVVWHSTASEHRIGPARLWVEQARELAASGVRSVRFDRRGTGDSGMVADNESTPAVEASARVDALDLVDALDIPSHNRLHVGLCSGAWLSAYTADQRGGAAVVLINNVNWSLQNLRLPIRKAQIDALESKWMDKAFFVLRAIRNFGRRLQSALPYRVWLTLSNAGYANAPESLLRQLDKKNIHATVVLSPEDLAAFNANRGETGMTRMRSAGIDSNIHSYAFGDHTLYEREIRTAARTEIVRVAVDTFHLRSSS